METKRLELGTPELSNNLAACLVIILERLHSTNTKDECYTVL